MTLSFSKKNITEHSFKEKIWASLGLILHPDYLARYRMSAKDIIGKTPKLHTIRKGNRWREGMKIHFVENNRTPKRFQFAPTIRCKRVQDFEVTIKDGYYILIDGEVLCESDIDELAINDGFDSKKEFIEYFNDAFVGQIIHWTDMEY